VNAGAGVQVQVTARNASSDSTPSAVVEALAPLFVAA